MYYRNLEEFMNSCGYLINDEWYPRVTSIVSIKSKPALLKFYGEAESFSSALSVTGKSATEGTKIHNTIEAILKNEPVEITSDIKPAIDAFYDFLKVHSVDISKGAIEKRIWTPKYRYAGTIDILGEVDGTFGILDIKTSSGIWRDYNLQTSAYMGALVKDSQAWEDLIPKEIQGRWILRIDQNQICEKCGAKKRTKGGRETIKENFNGNGTNGTCDHKWSETIGEWEIKSLDNFDEDFEAFLAAKKLWEWENEYWLKQIGF
ncbi:MAG TPA: hypothetical protein PLA57_02075 [Candidatus Paceibacterota bacterium]|jgi:hypothetical protein|nr:hypothetical protein [Candidatus Paceibacterota bacterium]HRS47775.1 hypothetical protein [Candidatus Paceibacterota bacterium]